MRIIKSKAGEVKSDHQSRVYFCVITKYFQHRLAIAHQRRNKNKIILNFLYKQGSVFSSTVSTGLNQALW